MFWKSGSYCGTRWCILSTDLPSFPTPPPPALQSPWRPWWNADPVTGLLRLKPLSDSLPWHVCSALLLQPCLLSVSPSPSWLYAEFPCAMFCYVLCLFHMLPALSTMPPKSTLPSQSCSASPPAGEVSDSPKPSLSEALCATALSLWGDLSASASLPCRTLNYKYFIPVVFPWQALF